jgi:hypothetical protein
MIGTLLGSQILPFEKSEHITLEALFGHTAIAVGLKDTEEFYKTFSRVRALRPDLQRITFLQYLEEIGKHFVSMAFADKSWEVFLKEVQTETPNFGRL